jgi:hypothetical protein
MESCCRFGMSASLLMLIYTFIERRWMGMDLGNDIDCYLNTWTFEMLDSRTI